MCGIVELPIVDGANFKNARLGGVNFSFSDLTEASFFSAYIDKAVFNQAVLNNTVWIDGQICNPKSIGTCRQ